MKAHVKKGDTVLVLDGESKGKKGKVLAVNPSTGRALVEGINMATKHKKPRSAQQPGGIIHQEAPVAASSLMVVCSNCGKPTRVAKDFKSDGTKFRKCKKCGEELQ